MKKSILFALAVVMALPALAQNKQIAQSKQQWAAFAAGNQQCKCTVTACTIISGPYPPSVVQPTLCNLQKNGVGAGSAAATTTVPVINPNTCSPSSVPDVGPAGSVYCAVPLAAFPAANNVSVTMTAQAASGTSAVGPATVFDNVVNFTNVVVDPPPNLRINQ